MENICINLTQVGLILENENFGFFRILIFLATNLMFLNLVKSFIQFKFLDSAKFLINF